VTVTVSFNLFRESALTHALQLPVSASVNSGSSAAGGRIYVLCLTIIGLAGSRVSNDQNLWMALGEVT
jgi:hypothetical protein